MNATNAFSETKAGPAAARKSAAAPQPQRRPHDRRLPLFLRGVPSQAVNSPAETEARHLSERPQKGAIRWPVVAGPTAADPFPLDTGQSHPLSDQERRRQEKRVGGDLSQVRIHDDPAAHRLTQSLGANALTHGRDIYFNQGRFRPETDSGRQLLAHELVHVRQQEAAGVKAIQFDLMQSMPTLLGAFDIEMATRIPPQKTGMEGNVRFLPDPLGPYSAEIGLVQVVNLTDVGGSSTTAGDPFDWSGTGEDARNDLMTTGMGAAEEGWFVDSNTAANPQGSSVAPDYIEHWISAAPDNQFGFLRSQTDIREASLWDYPGTGSNLHELDFDFETVAKGRDTQTVYGALHWGFGVRRGAVQNEYAWAVDGTSAEFDEALERYRGFYVHEPLVIYFDTGGSAIAPGEESKIAGVITYLNTYSDVVIRVDGYADERGGIKDNEGLAGARANAAAGLLLSYGISPGRLTRVKGHGETAQFAAGGDQGTWRANRRVMIRFERTASTPIATP